MNYAVCSPSPDSDALRIDMIVRAPSQTLAEAQALPGQSVSEVSAAVRDTTHYIKVSTGRANQRDMTPCTASSDTVTADASDSVTLSQMRANTQIEIAGPAADSFVASGSETLTFSVPGQYTITATAPFPAMPREIVIDAT